MKVYPLLFAIVLQTIPQNALCGFEHIFDGYLPLTSEEDYERREDQDSILLQIEEATRRRCPHIKIGGKVITLCHGEERWRKKLDCDHQQLFKFSDFYYPRERNGLSIQ